MADLPEDINICYLAGEFLAAVIDGYDAGTRPDGVVFAGLNVKVRALPKDLPVAHRESNKEIILADIDTTTDINGKITDGQGNPWIAFVAPSASLTPKGSAPGEPWKVTVTVSGPSGYSFPQRSKTFVPLPSTPEEPLRWTDIIEVVPSTPAELEALQAVLAEVAAGRAAAEAAAVQAAAFGGTNNEQVAGFVSTTGPSRTAVVSVVDESVGPLVADAIADVPEIAAAAAELAQSDAGLLRVEMLDPDTLRNQWELSFPGGETFLTYEEIPDDSPYLTWTKYNTGEFQSYVKKNGEVYPPVATVPVTPTTLTAQVVGDSVPENWGSYASGLNAALGRNSTFEAIGGQRVSQIGPRQGGVPARVTVSGDLIPASGTVSVTSITEADGTPVSPLLTVSDSTRTRTVVIGAARCTLTGVTSGGTTTYTLTQVGGVVAVPCRPGTPMVPPASPAGTLTILFGPRNNLGPNGTDAFRPSSLTSAEAQARILDAYTKMIARAKLNGGSVILLPVVPRSDADATGKANLVILNNMLRDLAPQDWADLNAWFASDAAFVAAGVTKTSQDSTDIANGLTPTSFTSDGLHPNAAGYAAANRFIELTRKARGL